MKQKYFSEEERVAASRSRARQWYLENSERAKSRIRAKYHATKVLKGRPVGDAHPNWKGGRVSYHALHIWLVRQLGTPNKCEHCGTAESRRYHWSNKDHEYRRLLSDWQRLCVPCHRKYDWEVLGVKPPWHKT
jgi:hypothetical protein